MDYGGHLHSTSLPHLKAKKGSGLRSQFAHISLALNSQNALIGTRTELTKRVFFGNGALYFKNKRQSRPRAALATHSRFSNKNCATDVGGRSTSASLWLGEPSSIAATFMSAVSS